MNSQTSFRSEAEPLSPFPVSVTVYNLLPSGTTSNDADDSETAEPDPSKRRWYRPDHSWDLLVSVRMDVYKVANGFGEPNETVLFSSINDSKGIHPSWQLEHETDIDWEVVEARLRISALRERKKKDKEDEQEQNDDSLMTPTVVVQDIPLSPKRLRRLPDQQTQSQNYLVSSWGGPHWPPPKSLPPNAVLIHFSDETVRVEPSLYYLLLDRKVIVEQDPRDTSLLQDDEEENRQATRFSDTAFDVLENHEENPRTASREAANGTGYFPSVLDTASSDLDSPRATSSVQAEAQVAMEHLLKEKTALEAMLESESKLLEEEMTLLRQERQELLTMTNDIGDIDSEIAAMEQVTTELREQHQRLHLEMEAQRIKLMRELREIYPVQCKPDQRYFIRGLELPADLWNGGIGEDEISAALGYLCHSLMMMSKYLNVPLRYRIVCNSSRSAIQDDNVNILPLFQSRVVEQYQLDQGMVLLHRNVECILKHRGQHLPEKAHVLAKLKRLYDTILGG